MKKSINTTTIEPHDKDATLRYKKTINDITEYGKQDTVNLKDYEYIHSNNNSGIFSGNVTK